MRRDDRELLADLSKINTALPAFAMRVMDNTATPAEHSAVAERLITLGQAIRARVADLTVINREPEPEPDGTGSANLAATHALSALVDMTHALGKARSGLPAHPDTSPMEWSS